MNRSSAHTVPPSSRPAFALGVMWKTVSEDCNLACDYCYYSRSSGHIGPRIQRIDDVVLEKLIREYMALSTGSASFAWQGGEPLLAGLDFFARVVELQARHAPPNTAIGNAVQTNGTLIDAPFARFFRAYNFLVGVSIDGPQAIHDARRVNRGGGGSFHQAMRGIQQLRRYGVDFNILTVIHDGNVGRVEELFAFYRQEKFQYVQFIPCMDFRAQETAQSAAYLISPDAYGQFLCDAFNLWYNDGRPDLSIRLFDNLLAVYMHQEAELCTHRAACASTLILERNGDAYPCDFYIDASHRLGNIGSDSLQDIFASPLYRRFRANKAQVADKCLRCQYRHLCHGGCPRNRGLDSDGQLMDLFCPSYLRLFEHAHQRLSALAADMRRRTLQRHVARGGRLPGRNDACLCGSGKKYKACCEPLSHSAPLN